MQLNHAQKEAVAHKEGPCRVLAGPGSGKTLTIAKRIEYLIMNYKVRTRRNSGPYLYKVCGKVNETAVCQSYETAGVSGDIWNISRCLLRDFKVGLQTYFRESSDGRRTKKSAYRDRFEDGLG